MLIRAPPAQRTGQVSRLDQARRTGRREAPRCVSPPRRECRNAVPGAELQGCSLAGRRLAVQRRGMSMSCGCRDRRAHSSSRHLRCHYLVSGRCSPVAPERQRARSHKQTIGADAVLIPTATQAQQKGKKTTTCGRLCLYQRKNACFVGYYRQGSIISSI